MLEVEQFSPNKEIKTILESMQYIAKQFARLSEGIDLKRQKLKKKMECNLFDHDEKTLPKKNDHKNNSFGEFKQNPKY